MSKTDCRFKVRGAEERCAEQVAFPHIGGCLECTARVVVQVDTIIVFKRLLDRHMDMQGMARYGSHVGKREITLTWCHVRPGLKGLFPCGTVL